MDGYEVARRIRSMPDQYDTLLIAIAGAARKSISSEPRKRVSITI
jgi:CheY-like chemotaxis protein